MSQFVDSLCVSISECVSQCVVFVCLSTSQCVALLAVSVCLSTAQCVSLWVVSQWVYDDVVVGILITVLMTGRWAGV